MIIQLLKKTLNAFGYYLVRSDEYDAEKMTGETLRSIVSLHTMPNSDEKKHTAEIIIFSMDRPLQLHALLGSYFENVGNRVRVTVLYRTSSEPFEMGYREVFAIYRNQNITAMRQENHQSFKKQLLNILGSLISAKILFLVDDIIFTEKLDFNDFITDDTRTSVPTLRMGRNLKRAYTIGRDQSHPPFHAPAAQGPAKLSWTWREGEYDWAYPLSVDGHLFSTREMTLMARSIQFTSPNTFESALQVYSDLFTGRRGICYEKSKIVNIPINRIQNDFDNIHGSVHQDYLLDQWNKGMQMDYRAFYGIGNVSAHQEFSITLINRNSSRT